VTGNLATPPSIRKRLPNRRANLSFAFECAGLKYTATIGYFPNGDLAEIFINNHKSNSDADVNGRDAAIVCSLTLQYGAPAEVLRKALSRDARGTASGPLATALDLILKQEDGPC
jgi:hypothetical protein